MNDMSELIEVASRPGEQWTPDLVEKRLIEALLIISATAGPIGPKGYGSGVPRDIVDAMSHPEVDSEEGEARWWEKPSAEESTQRRAIPARKVTAAEQASMWPNVYLQRWPGPKRVLLVYLRCKVYRRPFDKACKRRKWSRATSYRRKDKALGIIAMGLNKDGVEVRL